jgi:hypothetical protein
MVDGDQGTYWKTEHYVNNPAFGGKKRGMGVLIDLGSAKAVRTVKVSFANQGATVELRKGTSLPPATAAGDNEVVQTYEPIGQPQDAKSTIVLNSDGQPVQYLLIWITKLPPSIDDDSKYQVRILEIEVSAD